MTLPPPATTITGATLAKALQTTGGGSAGGAFLQWESTRNRHGDLTYLMSSLYAGREARLFGLWTGQLDALGIVDGGSLTVTFPAVVPLDAALVSSSTGGVSLTLIPQSDTDPTAFRVCWNLRTSAFARLSCGRFDRATSAWRGMLIVDDDLQGRITTLVDP